MKAQDEPEEPELGPETRYDDFDMLLRVGIVDETAPAIQIHGIENGQALERDGEVLISVTASDISGLQVVALYLDDVLLTEGLDGIEDYGWDTSEVDFGLHTLMARARDTKGNVAVATSTFTLTPTTEQSDVVGLAGIWEIKQFGFSSESDSEYINFIEAFFGGG